MRGKGSKLGEGERGKGSKLVEPCPKVRLSQDRFPIVISPLRVFQTSQFVFEYSHEPVLTPLG